LVSRRVTKRSGPARHSRHSRSSVATTRSRFGLRPSRRRRSRTNARARGDKRREPRGEKRRRSRSEKGRPARGPKGSRPGTRSSTRRSIQRRRTRTLLIASAVFAVVVLATSMPVSVLLSQHRQLSSTAKQLESLQLQNRALKREAEQLTNPATVADIARLDYGLVAPGSQAFEIVPAAGSPASTEQDSGAVPLDTPPVVPGSAQSQELLAAGSGSGGGSSAGTTGQHSSAVADSVSHLPGASGRPRVQSGASSGFWTRVAHTLEFWR
jgi:cell division protein FtsB